MPRVPIYDAPQESLRPLPNVALRAPQTQLPEVGAALVRSGGDLLNVARAQQDQQNADRLFRTEAALKEEYLNFETSLRERRGQNAWGVTQDVNQWWEDARERHTEGLENDTQRALFEQTFANLRLHSLDSASRYESQERRVSLEESARASITNSINLAAAQFDSPDAVDGAKADVLDRIQIQAEFNGWTPERRAAEESLQLTNLHKQVIAAMVDVSPLDLLG